MSRHEMEKIRMASFSSMSENSVPEQGSSSIFVLLPVVHLLRRQTAKGLMRADGIVIRYIRPNPEPQCSHVLVVLDVNILVLQTPEKPLRAYVIGTVVTRSNQAA